ncbi:52 kDa repressor of the inhibitor of the protein kinase-like, partial [Aphis craccivora]
IFHHSCLFLNYTASYYICTIVHPWHATVLKVIFKLIFLFDIVDSLILSPKERFSEKNEVPYSIFHLLPEHMSKLDENQYRSLTEKISNSIKILLLNQCFVFSAICIGLSFPATTCTAERSFSTLRRVKTWVRSTMTNERLDTLCMMNVHKSTIIDLINNNKYYEEIVDRFGRDYNKKIKL